MVVVGGFQEAFEDNGRLGGGGPLWYWCQLGLDIAGDGGEGVGSTIGAIGNLVRGGRGGRELGWTLGRGGGGARGG